MKGFPKLREMKHVRDGEIIEPNYEQGETLKNSIQPIRIKYQKPFPVQKRDSVAQQTEIREEVILKPTELEKITVVAQNGIPDTPVELKTVRKPLLFKNEINIKKSTDTYSDEPAFQSTRRHFKRDFTVDQVSETYEDNPSSMNVIPLVKNDSNPSVKTTIIEDVYIKETISKKVNELVNTIIPLANTEEDAFQINSTHFKNPLIIKRIGEWATENETAIGNLKLHTKSPLEINKVVSEQAENDAASGNLKLHTKSPLEINKVVSEQAENDAASGNLKLHTKSPLEIGLFVLEMLDIDTAKFLYLPEFKDELNIKYKNTDNEDESGSLDIHSIIEHFKSSDNFQLAIQEQFDEDALQIFYKKVKQETNILIRQILYEDNDAEQQNTYYYRDVLNPQLKNSQYDDESAIERIEFKDEKKQVQQITMDILDTSAGVLMKRNWRDSHVQRAFTDENESAYQLKRESKYTN